MRDDLHDADYLLFSVWDPSRARAGAQRGKDALAAGQYELVKRKDDVILLKKKTSEGE